MNQPQPDLLDGARVLSTAELLEGVRPTGATHHSIPNFEEVVRNLAIAQYDGDENIYLFYCTSEWEVVDDTYHSTVAEATAQAEFEFTNVRFVPKE